MSIQLNLTASFCSIPSRTGRFGWSFRLQDDAGLAVADLDGRVISPGCAHRPRTLVESIRGGAGPVGNYSEVPNSSSGRRREGEDRVPCLCRVAAAGAGRGGGGGHHQVARGPVETGGAGEESGVGVGHE